MTARIGLLMPRSTDYPAMGYEIVTALRSGLQYHTGEKVSVLTENIGFGDSQILNYSRAEKLLVQDEVDLLIVYSGSANAEPLYPLGAMFQKPILFLDAGMQFPNSVAPFCYHLSLQGLQACRQVGCQAGEGGQRVLMATSFYDGGYRGPWCIDQGIAVAGGTICGNYVSGYKVAEFTVAPYLELLYRTKPDAVAACFSTYLSELFLQGLSERPDLPDVPMYCSPFMAEEGILARSSLPKGNFHTVVPWASSLENEQQAIVQRILDKNALSIFHLLGWEAATVAFQALNSGSASLSGFCYESPRGAVCIHPATHHTYAPLYEGVMKADADEKGKLFITQQITVTAEDHLEALRSQPQGTVSNWQNNYFCT